MSKKLEKINYIKNIGRFYDVSIHGTADSDPSFRKFNLIYADNGTGKSTISTILKSLWKNEPHRLIEKKTIGADGESAASLEIGDETYTFQNGKWNKTPDIEIEIAIFDEEFVAKNVFSPNGIESENRRELFNYAVLGEENVDKVEKVKELNNFIKDGLNNKIEKTEYELKNAIYGRDIKILDDTIELDIEDLESLKNSVHKNNEIIKYAERITKEKELGKITEFKKIAYEESISVDLKSLSITAEYQLHVQTHNEWIKDGMEILQSKESCPFCFEKIKTDNKAIATYQALFSKEYESLREDIGEQIASVESIYSDAAIKNVIDSVKRNNELCSFWNSLDKKIPEAIALGISLKESAGEFKAAIKSLLERKKTNLLEVISTEKNEIKGLAQEEKFRQAITKYNIAVQELNNKIQTLKDKSQDIEELKNQTTKDSMVIICNDVRYRNKKTVKLYQNLKQNQQQKKEAEKKIKTLRDEIEQASLNILETYQKSINRELENFGVDFSIEGVKRKSDNTRKEGVYFNIRLRDEIFDPNGSGKNLYRLSNTLSSGDKSTLAFAFFIAKYRGKDISNQILVFDDPITSLDFFRKNQTKNTILRFVDDAAQVIILTHSIEFARLFKQRRDGHFVQMTKNNIKSGLTYIPYNKFSDMVTAKHAYHHNLIQTYIEDPLSVERIEVIKSVRPYAETVIKNYRNDFAPLSLGKMIEKLRSKGNICKDYIEDLATINDIVVPESSHGGAIHADDYEHISDHELMTACEKVIKITAPPRCQDDE